MQTRQVDIHFNGAVSLRPGMTLGHLAFDHLRYVFGNVAFLKGMGVLPGFTHGAVDRAHDRAEFGVSRPPATVLIAAPIAFLTAIAMYLVQLVVAIGVLLRVKENRRGEHRVGKRDVLAKQAFDKGELAMFGIVLR